MFVPSGGQTFSYPLVPPGWPLPARPWGWSSVRNQKLDFFKVKIKNPFASHRMSKPGWGECSQICSSPCWPPLHWRGSGDSGVRKENENLTETSNLLARMLRFPQPTGDRSSFYRQSGHVTWSSFPLFRKVFVDRQWYTHSWDRLAGPLPRLGLAEALGSRVMVSRDHTYSVPRYKNY